MTEVKHSHLGYVVGDSRDEQTMAYYLDNHPNVLAFAKNAGLGITIAYLHEGEYHEYVLDYLVRLQVEGREPGTLILEMMGYDPLRHVKEAAAQRWVQAVNAIGLFGQGHYRILYDPTKTVEAVTKITREWSKYQ